MKEEIKQKLRNIIDPKENWRDFKKYWWVYMFIGALLISAIGYYHDMKFMVELIDDFCTYCYEENLEDIPICQKYCIIEEQYTGLPNLIP
jgi:hypothetical protein